jgi:hypothetical protein
VGTTAGRGEDRDEKGLSVGRGDAGGEIGSAGQRSLTKRLVSFAAPNFGFLRGKHSDPRDWLGFKTPTFIQFPFPFLGIWEDDISQIKPNRIISTSLIDHRDTAEQRLIGRGINSELPSSAMPHRLSPWSFPDGVGVSNESVSHSVALSTPPRLNFN